MIDSKPWHQSKTVWASLFALLSSILGAFGFNLPLEVQPILTESVLQISSGIAALIALYGRITAKQKIV